MFVQFAGEWYDVQRTRFEGRDWFENGVFDVKEGEDGVTVFEYHATPEEGHCITPFTGLFSSPSKISADKYFKLSYLF